MEVSANFAFLKNEFIHTAESASYAERHVYADPRASSFHARHALEQLVKRVYRVDKALSPPKVTNLDGYLSEPTFRALVPEAVWQKAEYVRQAGNVAVHGKKPPTPEKALAVVQELFHVAYWAGRTYLRKGAEELQGKTYDESLVPRVDPTSTPVSLKQLRALEAKLAKEEQARQEAEEEMARLRERFAVIKAENEAVPETHDYNEAETRRRIIDQELQRAGWPLDQSQDREVEVTGMLSKSGLGYVDYVLWGDDGKPLAVVEAKKTTVDARAGQQQAKLYADRMQAEHGQRPLIYYTNGYTTWFWDDLAYPPRPVAGFHSKDELSTLIVRRSQRRALDVAQVKDAIAGRYYQKRAIGSICEQFTQSRRKALLVMATGTGKTRTAIALVDLLQRAGWIKRALFLADRISLVRQAVAAFKTHLPESSPVNLVTEKDKTGRVYVCTYPTMMGLINERRDGQARFGVGAFDLVIIDEAHRSVYKTYGAIFDYFDSLLVGLTATPSEQVNRDTYRLFDLEPGMPTDAYELDTAVADGFLVPPKVQQVDLKFPGQGIEYDDLSEEEKEQWEGLDWGDEVEPGRPPEKVDAAAINSWLFNQDTVDKVLQHVMEHGRKVDGGDRLAKTILFARNHDHATFIEERFNVHYPHYRGHFARVIDHHAKYPQSLIDDFSQKDKAPHLAISVDMLDTGIDIPEVANLVFFKPVYSKIKFWQMIGRGTRLCPDLYGPDEDKVDFRVFDFCFNFDFFGENPDGIESSDAAPLDTRIFSGRVLLLSRLQRKPDLDPESQLSDSLIDLLHGEVLAMNPENFIVRMHREAVTRFRLRASWNSLSDSDVWVLRSEIAGLPSETETDEIGSRLFDLKVLGLQSALVEGDTALFEVKRRKVIELACLLEAKTSIPKVAAQLEYLRSIQQDEFWTNISLASLEELRLRLRDLVQFLDPQKRRPVFTDFEDQVMSVREGEPVPMPRMTGAQYEKKVKSYLRNHLDLIAVKKLRMNKPLTRTDLEVLEGMLVDIGEDEGETLLAGLLARTEAPSIAHFVRSLVGLDRAAAQALFSDFLNDRSLTPSQIRFVEMVIEQLTSRGLMDASALYESPFTDLHGGGPDALFGGKENVIEGIFGRLEQVNAGLEVEAG